MVSSMIEKADMNIYGTIPRRTFVASSVLHAFPFLKTIIMSPWINRTSAVLKLHIRHVTAMYTYLPQFKTKYKWSLASWNRYEKLWEVWKITNMSFSWTNAHLNRARCGEKWSHLGLNTEISLEMKMFIHLIISQVSKIAATFIWA